MSLRRFNGWEPRSETVYVYDGQGRLERSVTSVEPEWDDSERAWALALADFETDQCPGCGGQLSETTDPATEERWRVGPPTRCHRCTALSVAQTKFTEGDTVRHPNALLWTAERR